MLFMKLNYEVEWELDDEVIDNIVNEIEETVKQYPNYDVDDCIYEFVANFLNDLDVDDCDHFNLDCYLHEVVREVKKRYLDRKQKATILPTTPAEAEKNKYYVEIVTHVLIEDDNPLFEDIIERNCNGVRQDEKEIKDAIAYIEKRMGLTFLGTAYPPTGVAQIYSVYRDDGEPVLES